MHNSDGLAALHMLAFTSDINSTTILFNVPNINKNIRTTHSFTPLHTACVTSADQNYIYFLLENNVDVNAPDRLGKRPVQYAVEKDSIQVVQWLVEFNVDLNYADDLGKSPLSIALLDRKNFDMAHLLLKSNANPNLNRGSGTPLFFGNFNSS